MAEISKSQDTKQPISPAVVGKVVQDNARTIADTAADTATRRGAEAVQQGSRATGEAMRLPGAVERGGVRRQRVAQRVVLELGSVKALLPHAPK